MYGSENAEIASHREGWRLRLVAAIARMIGLRFRLERELVVRPLEDKLLKEMIESSVKPLRGPS